MKRVFPPWAMALVALALLVSFGVDFSNTLQGGAVDFRNRITGARLLAHGIDPYHYIWHAGDPQEFCDMRVNLRLPVSKTTVTPAFLAFYLPLALLPYRAAQFTWLFAQWILLLGTVWFWLRAASTPLERRLMAVFAAGLTFTPAWRWEAERGQCYVLLVFLLACWMTMSFHRKRENGMAAGLIAGLLVALRPPFLMLIPFLVLHRRGQLAGAAAGVLLSVGLPMLLRPYVWNDYASAMQANSDFYRHASTPARLAPVFPATIEGTSRELMGRMLSFPFTDTSVYSLGRRLGWPPLSPAPLIVGFGGLFAGWVWLSRRQPVEGLLPGLAGWLFLADFFLPTLRWSYYDILILNVFLAGIAATGKMSWASGACALALPSAWILYFVSPAPLFLLLLAPFFLLLGAILSFFPSIRPEFSER